MAAEQVRYYRLLCDRECNEVLIEPDNEATVVDEDPEQLRRWGARAGWIVYQGRDVGPDCKVQLAGEDHVFTPDGDGLFCVVCRSLEFDPRHPPQDRIAGQLQILG